MNVDLYTGVAQTAAALASPTRLRALNLLFQGPKSIEALAELLGESHANTAAHMKALRAAGLVTAHRQGKYVLQRAVLPEALRVFLALRAAAEQHNPEVRLAQQAEAATASAVLPGELSELIAQRKAVVVDLRPELEWRAGHIPGAQSLPFEQIALRASVLPRKRRVLAYCRGKYCPTARAGVDALRGVGLRAERLAFGVPEWRGQGLPIAAQGDDGVVDSQEAS
jgi:DNA-binding transcriptional ArsR family regulator